MAYTTLKRLSVQSAGSASGTWGAGGVTGDDLNTGCFAPIDSILAGISSFSVSSSNVSLTFTAGGGGDVQNVFWKFTGVLTSSIVVSPTAGNATTYFNGFYLFENATTGNFTITVQNSSGSVVLPQGRTGLLYVNTTNSIAPRIVAIASITNADPIPTGTVMLFYQNAAPAGWTISGALNDYALKIVSSAGGVTSGSVAYSTLFARTATDSHTLTTSEMPLHGHPFRLGLSGSTPDATGGMALQLQNQTDYAAFTGTLSANPGEQIGGTGGGNGHTHDIDMRVLTASMILASKN